jgi:hypothetical protein
MTFHVLNKNNRAIDFLPSLLLVVIMITTTDTNVFSLQYVLDLNIA